MKSQVLHTVPCNISGKTAGELWIDQSGELKGYRHKFVRCHWFAQFKSFCSLVSPLEKFYPFQLDCGEISHRRTSSANMGHITFCEQVSALAFSFLVIRRDLQCPRNILESTTEIQVLRSHGTFFSSSKMKWFQIRKFSVNWGKKPPASARFQCSMLVE